MVTGGKGLWSDHVVRVPNDELKLFLRLFGPWPVKPDNSQFHKALVPMPAHYRYNRHACDTTSYGDVIEAWRKISRAGENFGLECRHA